MIRKKQIKRIESMASMTFATGQIDLDHSIILAKSHIVAVPEMINGVL